MFLKKTIVYNVDYVLLSCVGLIYVFNILPLNNLTDIYCSDTLFELFVIYGYTEAYSRERQ